MSGGGVSSPGHCETEPAASLLLPRSPVPAEGERMEIRIRWPPGKAPPSGRVVGRIGGREFCADAAASRETPRETSLGVVVPFGYRRLTVWVLQSNGRRIRLGRRWLVRMGPFPVNRWLTDTILGAASFLSDALGARSARWKLHPEGKRSRFEADAHFEGWFWHRAGPPEAFLFYSGGRQIASSPPIALPAWERSALGWLPPHHFWGFDQRLALPQAWHRVSVWARMKSGLRIRLGSRRVFCGGPSQESPPQRDAAALEPWPRKFLPLPHPPSGETIASGEAAREVLALVLDHIGDVACTLPALALLRERLPPGARLTVAAGPWALPLLERCPLADRVVTIPFFAERADAGFRNDPASLLTPLEGEAFSLAVDFRYALDTRILLRKMPARRLAAYARGDGEDWLWFRMPLPLEARRVPWKGRGPHAAELKLALAAALPIGPFSSKKEQPLPIFSLQELRPELLERLTDLPGSWTVGMHSGSGKRETQWPAECFGRLADLLIERLSARIVFCGGQTDREIAGQAHRAMRHPSQAAMLAGRTSLGEFLDLLPHLDLFIGNDSGPAHLAGLQGVPTLAIFGGSARVSEFHPLGPRCYPLRSNLSCSPCYRQAPDCPWNLQCLHKLTPDDAFAAVKSILREIRGA